MRGLATVLMAGLAFSAAATSASAGEQVPGEETLAQLRPAPTVDEPPVYLIEYGQPVLLAQTPLPQPRPTRIAAARIQPSPAPRRVAAAAPADTGAARTSTQRVALDVKTKSPLFWMTVGVGF